MMDGGSGENEIGELIYCVHNSRSENLAFG